MRGKSSAVSEGGGKTKTFTFTSATSAGNDTINGQRISNGEAVELEIGTRNVLFTSYSNYSSKLISESGWDVPIIFSSNVPTRAGDAAGYITFVMPDENVTYSKPY